MDYIASERARKEGLGRDEWLTSGDLHRELQFTPMPTSKTPARHKGPVEITTCLSAGHEGDVATSFHIRITTSHHVKQKQRLQRNAET